MRPQEPDDLASVNCFLLKTYDLALHPQTKIRILSRKLLSTPPKQPLQRQFPLAALVSAHEQLIRPSISCNRARQACPEQREETRDAGRCLGSTISGWQLCLPGA